MPVQSVAVLGTKEGRHFTIKQTLAIAGTAALLLGTFLLTQTEAGRTLLGYFSGNSGPPGYVSPTKEMPTLIATQLSSSTGTPTTFPSVEPTSFATATRTPIPVPPTVAPPEPVATTVATAAPSPTVPVVDKTRTPVATGYEITQNGGILYHVGNGETITVPVVSGLTAKIDATKSKVVYVDAATGAEVARFSTFKIGLQPVSRDSQPEFKTSGAFVVTDLKYMKSLIDNANTPGNKAYTGNWQIPVPLVLNEKAGNSVEMWEWTHPSGVNGFYLRNVNGLCFISPFAATTDAAFYQGNYTNIGIILPDTIAPDKGINWTLKIFYGTGQTDRVKTLTPVNFGQTVLLNTGGVLGPPSFLTNLGIQVNIEMGSQKGAKSITNTNILKVNGLPVFFGDSTAK